MFEPFALEQFLSEHEQGVEFNFSESGVHPLTLGELLALAGRPVQTLETTSLGYPEVRGGEALRALVAGLYDDATPDNVLVTVGASEANHLVAATLLEPGDEVVAMRPTYQQLAGNARNRGVEVNWVELLEGTRWSVDLDGLRRAVTNRTKIVAVVNPNNPTGHILDEEERAEVIETAARVGAWVVADEVYAGTERELAESTRTLWGSYERVVAINSMSKAYGLPGLRLGWLVAPCALIPALWRRHEYATISAGGLASRLASIALASPTRERLIGRARQFIRTGFEVLEELLPPSIFSVVPPQASAMSFVRYELGVDSMTFATRLVRERNTLVLPGCCFGREHHLRVSTALPEGYLREGLSRLVDLACECGTV